MSQSSQFIPQSQPISNLHIRFVLNQTSHSGNVGAVARAIKVMGFTQLCLVQPACKHLDEQAYAMASHAQDILQQAIVYSSFDDAIASASLNIALTARRRYYSPPIITSKALCTNIKEHYIKGLVTEHTPINIIFGNEQSGLSNEDILKCSHILHIDTNAAYSSLNLAQAVQIIAYELSSLGLCPISLEQNANLNENIKSDINLATAQQVKDMHQHILNALAHIDFYDANAPKKLAERLQQLWAKAQLNHEDIQLLRGIAKAILKI
jgi:tRNA/rRNA methyltransferase